jgi:hypothetical protein
MKPLRIARHGLLVAVTLALLVACTSAKPGSSEVTSGPTDSSGPAVTSGPPIEGSGPESPQQFRPGQPSLNLARLPIGGSGDGSGGAAQCAEVNLLTEIPKGVLRISVSGLAFAPQGIFRTGGDGCGGQQQPLCKEFSAQHTKCYVPVLQVKDSNAPLVILTLSGTATCLDSGSCAEFAKNAKQNGQQEVTLQPQLGVVGPSSSTSVSSNSVRSTSTQSSASPTSGG